MQWSLWFAAGRIPQEKEEQKNHPSLYLLPASKLACIFGLGHWVSGTRLGGEQVDSSLGLPCGPHASLLPPYHLFFSTSAPLRRDCLQLTCTFFPCVSCGLRQGGSGFSFRACPKVGRSQEACCQWSTLASLTKAGKEENYQKRTI